MTKNLLKMKCTVHNMFISNDSSRHRRSTTANNNNNNNPPVAATMYDLIDQAHDWNKRTTANLTQHVDSECMDGFWKVFMLNEKTGSGRCCQRSSSFTTKRVGGVGGVRTDQLNETGGGGCGGGVDDFCFCMKHSKTARRRRFKSQSGYYLAIMPNGQIMGVKDGTSPYSRSFVCFTFDGIREIYP